jgi:hypothetical protein
MSAQLRDPTAEIASELRPRQSPVPTLAGKCVALLDIGKMRGDEFIDRLEILLNARGIAHGATRSRPIQGSLQQKSFTTSSSTAMQW